MAAVELVPTGRLYIRIILIISRTEHENLYQQAHYIHKQTA